MISSREIFIGLYGAYRLARLDRAGINLFDATIAGFWRSFFAAVIIAPPYLTLLLARYDQVAGHAPFARFIIIHAIAYVIAWVLFPLLMATITKALNRERFFIRFVVAYNWAAVWQNALYLPVALLATAGLLGQDPASMIGLVVLCLILAYTWFVTRIALEVSSALAAGIVGLDFLLSIVINAVAEGMV